MLERVIGKLDNDRLCEGRVQWVILGQCFHQPHFSTTVISITDITDGSTLMYLRVQA